MVKVLIVDDEESILCLLSAIVGTMPECVVLSARTGQEAIETVRLERPDIILLDNIMPGMSGIEVCRSIKTDPELLKTRILMLSCQGQNFDWEKAREFGASGYLSKPFDTTAVLEKIKELAYRPGTAN